MHEISGLIFLSKCSLEVNSTKNVILKAELSIFFEKLLTRHKDKIVNTVIEVLGTEGLTSQL
jgi:hypothetical protein